MLISILAKINKTLNQIAEKLLIIFLLANVTFVFMEVIFRYVFNSPLGWTYEVTVYLMVWSAFLGSSIVSRKREHISVDSLVNKLPFKYRKIVNVISNLLVLYFLYFIITSGLDMIEMTSGARSPSLRIPMIWVYSSIPIGFGLIVLQTLEIIFKDLFEIYKVFTNDKLGEAN